MKIPLKQRQVRRVRKGDSDMTINPVSIVFFILAGVFFVAAVYMFIRFNIPQVFGELSGKTAKKSIEQMRNDNAKSGKKSHHPSPAAVERGKLTDTMEHSKSLKKHGNKSANVPVQNAPAAQQSERTDVLPVNGGNAVGNISTDVLGNSTEILTGQTEAIGTEILTPDVGTELLASTADSYESGETQLLDNQTTVLQPQTAQKGFKTVKSIVLIHTDEII